MAALRLDHAAILRDYARGEKIAVIAAVHGCTDAAVSQIASRAGQKGRASRLDHEAILAAYESGVLVRHIATMHGCTQATVSNIVKRKRPGLLRKKRRSTKAGQG